jgi:hypothetical protein
MSDDDEISEEEWDQLWAEEAARRYAEFKAGRMEAIPAEEVFARLKARKKLPRSGSGG